MGTGARLRLGRGYMCLTPLRAGTWRCCGGRGSTTVREMRQRVQLPLRTGTWRCCGGRGRTTARGILGRGRRPLRAGTWRLSGGWMNKVPHKASN